MTKTGNDIKTLKNKVAKLQCENELRKKEIKENSNQLNLITDSTIVKMLQETNSPYSDKQRFSYDEISNATGRSTGYISNMARDNNLSRRNIKIIK